MRLHATQSSVLVFALFALLFCASPLACQEGADEVDSWLTQLEFGLNGASGNSSFSVLRTGASLKYLPTEVMEFELSALFRYGKSDAEVISNDLRSSAKLDWRPQATFSPFVTVTASRDRIRKIDGKINGGVGAKWTALRRDRTMLFLSLAGVFDYENYELTAGSTDPASESTVRISARVKFDHEFPSGATFSHVTFWQPEAGNLGDYNIEMTNSVTTKLLGSLTLAVEHEYLHDEVPPPDVKKNDQKFSVVLRVIL